MKSRMLSRLNKKSTILVSQQTLEQAVQEGEALAEQMLNADPHDPKLDQLEQAVSRLQGILHTSPQELQANGVSSLEDYLDDTTSPGFAEEIKRDVDMIAQMKNELRQEPTGRMNPGTEGREFEASVDEKEATSGEDAFVTDRDQDGKAKTPERAEVPRLARKKK